MKILVLGATGATGRKILKLAIEKQYHITAYVRKPFKLKDFEGKIEIVKGELGDTLILNEAIKGCDAVISALGYRNLWDKSLFISKAIENVIKAMVLSGVNKMVYESASGIGGQHSVSNPVLRFFLKTFGAANPFIDHNLTEKLIKESKINWTIIRPGILTHGKLRTKFRMGENLKRVTYISRADVAYCMIDALTRENLNMKSIDISY
jgi:uncharacterized protein YbjT (DUF2867 family)